MAIDPRQLEKLAEAFIDNAEALASFNESLKAAETGEIYLSAASYGYYGECEFTRCDSTSTHTPSGNETAHHISATISDTNYTGSNKRCFSPTVTAGVLFGRSEVEV